MKIFNGIGTGSQLLPRKTVQKGAMIGAEAVVIKEITPYSIAVGVPAKIVQYL
jgi:acetyltransferase-like isoleucine patch superfamily enzyme